MLLLLLLLLQLLHYCRHGRSVRLRIATRLHLRPAPATPPAPPARRPAGLLLLSLLCAASIYTSYLLAALHETPTGERLNTYREMGEALLGAWRRVAQSWPVLAGRAGV